MVITIVGGVNEQNSIVEKCPSKGDWTVESAIIASNAPQYSTDIIDLSSP